MCYVNKREEKGINSHKIKWVILQYCVNTVPNAENSSQLNRAGIHINLFCVRSFISSRTEMKQHVFFCIQRINK